MYVGAMTRIALLAVLVVIALCATAQAAQPLRLTEPDAERASLRWAQQHLTDDLGELEVLGCERRRRARFVCEVFGTYLPGDPDGPELTDVTMDDATGALGSDEVVTEVVVTRVSRHRVRVRALY